MEPRHVHGAGDGFVFTSLHATSACAICVLPVVGECHPCCDNTANTTPLNERLTTVAQDPPAPLWGHQAVEERGGLAIKV